MKRSEIFPVVRTAAEELHAVVVAGNGLQARFLHAAGDRGLNFYMLGSMGLAASIGLGIALGKPEQPVVVVEGDGNALMGMGAMTMVGYWKPAAFVHVVLNNGVYETTGGQPTVAPGVDFPAIAMACGYAATYQARTLDDLQRHMTESVRQAAGPVLIQVALEVGEPRVERVPYHPAEVTRQFATAIR